MKGLNSKLAMENFLIMQQNEKLKKMTEFFSHENQALLNELNHQLAAAAAAGIPIPDHLNRPTSTSSSAAATTSPSNANKFMSKVETTSIPSGGGPAEGCMPVDVAAEIEVTEEEKPPTEVPATSGRPRRQPKPITRYGDFVSR
ncbi:hypothetical protein SASPL_102176 [Salvia splendens]|uniref:Uncharacterized protein n=1 Tax=Salvia splendens TaxID=180675 RepID=A0A8X9AE59_SALSN|nr:hypothetical protein SASPL_102176 [Salvia splendens]